MFNFEDREMVVEKLKELKESNIPTMTYEKLCDTIGDLQASKEEINKINKYFSAYCECGYNDGKDIFSNEECSFYWGLAHGEMVTNDNGMNRTFYHYLTVNGERKQVRMLLQYHPNVYDVAN